MANAEDAERLRQSWSPSRLESYEGQWIAFSDGEVRGFSSSLDELSLRYAADISGGKGPIFAFVTFRELQ